MQELLLNCDILFIEINNKTKFNFTNVSLLKQLHIPNKVAQWVTALTTNLQIISSNPAGVFVLPFW